MRLYDIFVKVLQKIRKARLDSFFGKNPNSAFRITLPNGDSFDLWPDELSYSLYVYHNFENVNRTLWEKIITAGSTVIDIGANWGIYTVPAARLAGKRGKVFAFEPNPVEFEKLKNNIELNKQLDYAAVKLNKLAIAEKKGSRLFYTPVKYKGAYGSLEKPNINEPCQVIETSVTTVNDFVRENQINQLDIIKIDTEGAELPILQGAKETIKYFKPIIIMEASDKRTKNFNYEASELCTFLENLDYEIFVPSLSKTNNIELTPLTKPYSYMNHAGIAAVKKGFIEQLKQRISEYQPKKKWGIYENII